MNRILRNLAPLFALGTLVLVVGCGPAAPVVEDQGDNFDPQTTRAGQPSCQEFGLSDCNGDCVDLDTSFLDCGACGHACLDNQSCDGGACVEGCAADKTDCAGECVDLHTSATHCGACARNCADINALTCVAGQCQTCAQGFGDCNGNANDGCETSTRTSDLNCGGCGQVCGSGQHCAAGICQGGGGAALCAADIPAHTYTCGNVSGLASCGCGGQETASCASNQEATFAGTCNFHCAPRNATTVNCGNANTINGRPDHECIWIRNADGSLDMQCFDGSGNSCAQHCLPD